MHALPRSGPLSAGHWRLSQQQAGVVGCCEGALQGRHGCDMPLCCGCMLAGPARRSIASRRPAARQGAADAFSSRLCRAASSVASRPAEACRVGISARLYRDAFQPMLLVGLFSPGAHSCCSSRPVGHTWPMAGSGWRSGPLERLQCDPFCHASQRDTHLLPRKPPASRQRALAKSPSFSGTAIKELAGAHMGRTQLRRRPA